MNGTIQEKLKIFFFIYDKNKNNFINKSDFEKLLDNIIYSFTKVVNI